MGGRGYTNKALYRRQRAFYSFMSCLTMLRIPPRECYLQSSSSYFGFSYRDMQGFLDKVETWLDKGWLKKALKEGK